MLYRAEGKIWRTQFEGDVHVVNMTDSHIENTVNMLKRRIDEAAAWVRTFQQEQMRRKMENARANLPFIREQQAVERSSLFHKRSRHIGGAK